MRTLTIVAVHAWRPCHWLSDAGTHFVTELTLGGKTISSKYVTKQAMEKAQSTETAADVAVSGKGYSVEASLKVSMDLQESSSSSFASEVSGHDVIVMGGDPVGDTETMEGFAAWADTVTTNPMPIKYKLAPHAALSKIIAANRDSQCPDVSGALPS